jgi:hypothetical protein
MKLLRRKEYKSPKEESVSRVVGEIVVVVSEVTKKGET